MSAGCPFPAHRAVLVSWCAGLAHSGRNTLVLVCNVRRAEGVVQALLKLTTVIKHITPVPPSGKRTPSVTLLDQVHARLPFVVVVEPDARPLTRH